MPNVLQFHVPNKVMKPEKYVHFVLFMYYPFLNKEKLKYSNPPKCTNKFVDPVVVDIVNQNRA